VRHRPWVTGVVSTAFGLLLLGCGGSDPPGQHDRPTSRPATTRTLSPDGRQLPTGKSDLALDPATYGSPEGFDPALTFVIASAGWRSTHRGPDGFDVSQPDPTKDAPLVALVLTTPTESTAAEAFDALQARATAAGAQTRTSQLPVAGLSGPILDVRDGNGPLVVSAQGGIALDAAPGQRAQVAVLEVGGRPVVATILVPTADRWSAGIAAALPVLASIAAA
jgi:hypothetical protein